MTYRTVNNTNIRHAGRDTTATMQGSTIYRKMLASFLLQFTVSAVIHKGTRLHTANYIGHC